MAGMATVGMTAVRFAGWAVSDWLFLIASMLIFLRVLTGVPSNIAKLAARRTSPTVLLGLTILTVGGLLATMLRSFDPGASALALVRVWYVTILWFWTVRSVSVSLRTFQKLLLAAIVGVVVHSLVGVFQDISGANNVYPDWGRSRGLSDHFTDLGASIGSLLPIMVVWPTHASKRRGAEVVRIGAVLLCLAGVGASGAMTALGAGMIGMATALLAPRVLRARRRVRRRVLLPGVATVLVLAGLAFGVIQLPVITRFTELTSGGSNTTMSARSRVDMAEIALDGIVDSPLVGVGLDHASGAGANPFDDDLAIHNFYLRLGFEAGLLGVTGLLLMLFVTYRQAVRLLYYTRNTPIAWMANGIFGSLVMVTIAGLFQPVLYNRIFWLPLALVSALMGLQRAGAADDPAEPVPPQAPPQRHELLPSYGRS